jgi:hypothetical protein
MKEKIKGRILWIVLFLIVVVAGIFYGWQGIITVGLVYLFGFIIIWVGLARRNICFTFVEEGTAKVIMKAGAFYAIILQWEEHWMDKKYNVWRKTGDEESIKQEFDLEEFTEEEKEKIEYKPPWFMRRIFGGLWFYGIWPFFKVYKYQLRWADLHRERDVEKPKYHDEIKDNVFLRPAVYWTEVKEAETVPPERIPVTLNVLITMKVLNPYKFLFIAPSTPIEEVLARIDALIRERVAHLTVDDVLRMRAETLWEGWAEKDIDPFKEEKLVTETLVAWGFKIAEKGVDIKRVILPEEYQEALAIERRRELESLGRAQEIMGTIISSVATATGKTREEIQREFEEEPKEFYQEHKELIDNIMTKIAIEKGLYYRIESLGAEDSLGSFLQLIAAWKGISPGGKKIEKKKKRKPEEISEEEFIDELGRD